VWVAATVAACVVLGACGGDDDDVAAPEVAATLPVAASIGAAPTAAAPTPVATTPTSTTPAPPAAPAPCRAIAVGDSIGTGVIKNGFGPSLAGVGCELLWSGGYPGITIADGATALASAEGQPADVAVVVLGYHNTRSETRSGRFPRLIDTVMKAAGERIVVWPLLGRTPDCSATYSNAVAAADQLLRAATARWPNLVLVDYPSVIGAHPEYSEHRCPHLVASGYRATAQWLAGEVRRVIDASAHGA